MGEALDISILVNTDVTANFTALQVSAVGLVLYLLRLSWAITMKLCNMEALEKLCMGILVKVAHWKCFCGRSVVFATNFVK